MLKKVKKIVALMMATMALSTLFVTTAFAQENDVEVIEEAKILEEIVSYLEDGVTIDACVFTYCHSKKKYSCQQNSDTTGKRGTMQS